MHISHLLDEVEQTERENSECIGKYERERNLILRGRFYQFNNIEECYGNV